MPLLLRLSCSSYNDVQGDSSAQALSWLLKVCLCSIVDLLMAEGTLPMYYAVSTATCWFQLA